MSLDKLLMHFLSLGHSGHYIEKVIDHIKYLSKELGSQYVFNRQIDPMFKIIEKKESWANFFVFSPTFAGYLSENILYNDEVHFCNWECGFKTKEEAEKAIEKFMNI